MQTQSAATVKTGPMMAVWLRTKYRPLSLPFEWDGKLVASFRLVELLGLKRLGLGEESVPWTALQTEFETFYTTLSAEQFEQFVGLVKKEWFITKTTLLHFPLYELYQAVSRDRTMKTEFSFLPPFFLFSSAEDRLQASRYPDGNVWIRLERMEEIE
jgi:hypothetical protein